MKDTFTFK